MNITKENNGTLEICGEGVFLKINPIKLWHNSLTIEAKCYVDNIIQTEFKEILKNLLNFYLNEYKQMSKEKKEIIENDDKLVYPYAYAFSMFMHTLLPLLSTETTDFDEMYDKCNDVEKECIDWATSLYKYSTKYGYVKAKQEEIIDNIKYGKKL